jgi:hypothetical protein
MLFLFFLSPLFSHDTPLSRAESARCLQTTPQPFFLDQHRIN